MLKVDEKVYRHESEIENIRGGMEIIDRVKLLHSMCGDWPLMGAGKTIQFSKGETH